MLPESIAHRSLSSLFVVVQGIAPCPVRLKLEGLNAAGSIKLKTALQMVIDLEEAGGVAPGARFVESSSGNLGVALALICAERGYRFTCVTDPNAAPSTVAKMRALGAEVITVEERDATGNYLGTRIDLVQRLCAEDPDLIWLNQYANQSNWRAHYRMTGPEILAAAPRVDCLVVGTGTTGTLMGLARYFREHSPETLLVGVDSMGSVTFGGASGKRWIPGLGTSRKPPMADASLVDEVLMVDEADAVRMCRTLAQRGLTVGGSTGAVLQGVRYLADRFTEDSVVVALSPDMGDKYLDTIYSDDWVRSKFPAAFRALPAMLAAESGRVRVGVDFRSDAANPRAERQDLIA
ncbi:2,3-diaminopropionate biosynthesis protein SbnA [Kitasatospora phosalacinea]|uniref:2,3-diaminopropionate biosynthesis protein SbnA n=1 Tax=Kitasatospora phosalacinea TaxID=2065 RepID=A0ABW6GIA4_9ACTN